ncbi:MAG: hypothetical protein AAF990_00070 [Bacteroidota bacterium]
MNSTILTHTLRFIGITLFQVLLLKGASPSWENFNYIQIFLYPVFIMLLPLRTPNTLVIFLGFVTGLAVDLFYDSVGVHASACVFMAFIRPAILALVEPRGGYNVNHSPTKRRFGIGWFTIYSSCLMFAFLFWYFSVEAFTFYYFWDILLRTLSSFLVSMVFVVIYQYIFDPKE